MCIDNKNMHIAGLSIVGSSGGGRGEGDQTCFSTLVLFSMYTLEILRRGNQPQGVGDTCAPHPLNKSLCIRNIHNYTHAGVGSWYEGEPSPSSTQSYRPWTNERQDSVPHWDNNTTTANVTATRH